MIQILELFLHKSRHCLNHKQYEDVCFDTPTPGIKTPKELIAIFDRLINDDSTNLQKYLNQDYYSDKTLFFFDAHVDNNSITNYKRGVHYFAN